MNYKIPELKLIDAVTTAADDVGNISDQLFEAMTELEAAYAYLGRGNQYYGDGDGQDVIAVCDYEWALKELSKYEKDVQRLADMLAKVTFKQAEAMTILFQALER